MISEVGLYFKHSPFIGGVVDGLINFKNKIYPIEFKGLLNKNDTVV